MNGRRKMFFGFFAAFGLIMLYACSLLPGNLEDGVIALNVGTSGQFRAIEVKDYDVESLDLEILAPDPDNPGEEISVWSEHWLAPDPQRYVVQGIGAGTYRIVVTHNGVNGDETLSVTEDANFSVAAMKITTINVVPGLLGVLNVEGDETDPVDLTGPWTLTWNLVNGTVVHPMYITLIQNDEIVDFDFGASGTILGNNLSVDNAFIEDLYSYFSWDAIVNSTGDVVEGPFALLDDIDGTPITHPEFPEWGPFEGDMTLVRTDPALLGQFTIDGFVDWEEWDWESEPPVLMDSGSELIRFSSTKAMASFGSSDEGPYENLDIGAGDPDTVVSVWFSFQQTLEEGSYPVSSSGLPEPFAWLGMRYFVDGVGFDEAGVALEGVVNITMWDDTRVVGEVVRTGDIEPLMTFDVPIAPSPVW